MQLRRAMEIVNTQDNNSNIFYKENPVKILSVDMMRRLSKWRVQ